MSTDTENALFLFGGSEKVFNNLTKMIRSRLKDRANLDVLEDYLGLEKNKLQEILDGRKEADKNVFLALKSTLKLSLQEVFGEPEQLNNPRVREYWQEKCKTKPMRLVACTGVPSGSSIPKNPIDLKMYVTLRAIGEFYRLKDQQGS